MFGLSDSLIKVFCFAEVFGFSSTGIVLQNLTKACAWPMNADVLFCICLALHRCPVLYSLVSPLQYCIVLYRCSALVMQVLCFVEVLVLPKQVLLFAGIETYQ